MKTIAFFNNKGGVGKTSLVYHLAWMFADRGIRTIAVDLDPQANLTAMFLNESKLEKIWPDNGHPETIFGSIEPIQRGLGDIAKPNIEKISDKLGLIPGDLALSNFEDKLSESWPKCHNRDEAAFRVMTAFYRLISAASDEFNAELVLIDVGPNLGAINRSAIIASDQVILPLAPDLFSLQGLKNLGPTLRAWRSAWSELTPKAPKDLLIPNGSMAPAGYIVMQHGIRDSRPVKAYQRWLDRIPTIYRSAVLDTDFSTVPAIENDEFSLAKLKHYRSLMPMAMEANKPIFFLKSSDGAIGAHMEAVNDCYLDFLELAKKIGKGVGITVN
ncbi:ParA family protein [Undibacterium danionis]|uniref:ParA family protein n=1 Tax=Undibacterium danionis TaxID=1812100 RepID=A0ABV6IK79_9BURK